MVFLGRLLRFQGFDSESQTELRKAFTRAQGVARKDRKEAKKALQIARAYVTGKMSEKAEDTHVRKAAKQWISSMRPLLAEHIIRRSITSKGPGGAPISNLKMYHQVYIHCELTEEERFVQLTVADELTEQEVQVDKKANVSSLILPLGRTACVPCAQPWRAATQGRLSKMACEPSAVRPLRTRRAQSEGYHVPPGRISRAPALLAARAQGTHCIPSAGAHWW